jgi:signal transduction histidine kinase
VYKNKRAKITILQYWTRRYLFTLFIGLLLIGIIFTLWARNTTIQNRLQLLQVFTQDVADRVEVRNGRMLPSSQLPQMIDNRKGFFQLKDDLTVKIVDTQGNTVFNKAGPPAKKADPPPANKLGPPPPPPPVKEDTGTSEAGIPPAPKPAETTTTTNKPMTQLQEEIYTISSSIMSGNEIIGTVNVATTKRSINEFNQEYWSLALFLGGFALLGWLVIYLLSKKLSSPIRLVAEAAKQVKDGNYLIELPFEAKELEIDELFHAFKEMAFRLNQLEDLRTEMLAGVTHELKTPLTSIRGLVYAVKDKVVTGTEAEEFLDISITETDRLQNMVNELLDFNSFAAGVISLNPLKLQMNALIREIVYQWGIIHQNDELSLHMHVPDKFLKATGDAARIQQIMINLLNNAKESMAGNGSIAVTLYQDTPHTVSIDVKDSGCGIPLAEQSLIFERFYRGDNKKHKQRGLGLGLAFSSSLARAMGGELKLKESSPDGTTFKLSLPSL